MSGRSRVFPLGLLAAIVLAHGLLLPRLGFFWDDFPTAWFNYLQGPPVYWKVYADVRPFLPWVYMLTTPWLGWSPLAWHAFGLLARWASVLAAWGFLRTLWPTRRIETALAVLALALYPGFKQGPIPIIYSHFFLLMALSLLSLTWMLRAAREREGRARRIAGALLGASLSIFSIEYFVGLELLRPLALWMVLGQTSVRGWVRVRRAFVAWIPFAALLAVYFFWRVWVFEFPSYQPSLVQGLRTDWAAGMGALGISVLLGLRTAVVDAWGQVVAFPGIADVGKRVFLGYALVSLATAALSWVLLHAAQAPAGDHPDVGRGARDRLGMLGFGLAAILAGGLPVWVTQLPVTVDYPWDRMTLPLMLGACLILAAIVALLVHPVPLRLGLAALMLGLAAGVHYRSGGNYSHEWVTLRSFLWQLRWRVPDLAPGTTLITNDIPLRYYSDNSLTAPVNWMYSPENHTLSMDYMVYYPTVRVGRALSIPQPGLPIVQPYRAASFTGSTSQVLALYFAPPGCLRVLDVVLDDSMPNLPATLSAWVPLSRLDLIRTEGGADHTPPLMPQEPAHDWCYYFELADLARQRGAWDEVVELGDRGFAEDHPNDASERLVFIEANAHTGNWGRAEELSLEALEQNPAVDRMVCHTWRRLVEQIGSDAAREGADRVGLAAGCTEDS